MDVCRGAAIVALSIVGLLEPTDDLAAIIEVWYRDTCRRLAGTITVDLGPVDLQHTRSGLAELVESECRWPGDALPFRAALDEIAGQELRR